MAGHFTKEEWSRINTELEQNPNDYGFPVPDNESIIIGSFNIRKLGGVEKRNSNEWGFLSKICSQFQLLGIQEVMDELEGIKHLKKLVIQENANFRMLISDATGAFPGETGLTERLCFLYNIEFAQRDEVASDVTYDRTKLIATIYENLDRLNHSFSEFRKKMESYQMELRKSKPDLKMPVFLSFIRQPYCAAFRLGKKNSVNPYEIMAINAHLLYGNYISDREQEFKALMEWIIERVKKEDKTYYDNFILFGDLNLNFDDPEKDINRISGYMKDFDSKQGNTFSVNFPFLDIHPTQETVWRTNARQSETFDHIGFFFNDDRLPDHKKNKIAGNETYDYQVFNFVKLFAKATENKMVDQMDRTERKAFYAKFEHTVSDHMPIWVRLPLPK